MGRAVRDYPRRPPYGQAAGGAFRLFFPCETVLQNQAARAVRFHVTRRIEEPDSFPFVEEGTQIFRRVEELLGATGRIS